MSELLGGRGIISSPFTKIGGSVWNSKKKKTAKEIVDIVNHCCSIMKSDLLFKGYTTIIGEEHLLITNVKTGKANYVQKNCAVDISVEKFIIYYLDNNYSLQVDVGAF